MKATDNINDLVSNVASQNSDIIDSFFGFEQVFNAGDTQYISAVVLDSTHICVSYMDNNGYGTSIIQEYTF